MFIIATFILPIVSLIVIVITAKLLRAGTDDVFGRHRYTFTRVEAEE